MEVKVAVEVKVKAEVEVDMLTADMDLWFSLNIAFVVGFMDFCAQ